LQNFGGTSKTAYRTMSPDEFEQELKRYS